MKKAFRFLQDSHPVNSISFHPSGDYLLAGTDHESIRLYDIKTFQAFVTPDVPSNHNGRISVVRYSPMGNIFASGSDDGTIKLWDGVSSRCIHTFQTAHNGADIYSLQWSKNGKYLLSTGRDSVPKLWDVTMNKVVRKYEGVNQSQYKTQCVFDYSEDYILSTDENGNAVVCWDTKTSKLLQRWSGHANVIVGLAASPNEPCFISCSEDHRARYWNTLEDTSNK
jgi:cleavage stimulation factor subunit 1